MPEVARKQSGEIPVSFKLKSDLVKQIDEISKREQRSRTGTVRLALIAFIEAETERWNSVAGKKAGARNGR